MGLLKMSGDIYSLYEETKVAANMPNNVQGDITAMDSVTPARNPVPDSLPAPVNAGLKAPSDEVKPQESTAPRNLYSPGPESLPQISQTKTNSYKGTRMSKLRELLYKQAMTQSDLDASYYGMEEDPYSAQGTLGTREAMSNYVPSSDYSNYMAASPYSSAQQESYDIGASDMDAMYDESYPQSEAMVSYDQPQEEYSSYAPSIYEDYDTMGYSPEVLRRYEQMYASPIAEEPSAYTDMQVSATPEEQQLAKEHAAYEQSYNEIYQYLVQMGYSPEEAAAAAPSLLSQVSVAPPQQVKQAQIKVASQTFKQAGDRAVYNFIEAGYSPYQARQMAVEIVVPQAEKYASLQARALGGIAGGVLGGLGGHSAYDDGGEIGGGLTSAALGAGLGALVGGRVPRYLASSHMGEAAKLQKLQARNLQNAKDIAASLGVKKVDKVDDIFELSRRMEQDHRLIPSIALEKQFRANRSLGDDIASLQRGGAATQYRNYRSLAREAAMENLKSDLGTAAKVIVPGAIPAYAAHAMLSSDGGDNIVDNAFDASTASLAPYVDSSRELIGDATEAIRNNPGTAAVGAGLLGTAGLAAALRNRQAAPPTKKKKVKS